MAATAKSVKNVPKFVSLETKLHLERRGEPVIGLDQIEVIKPRTNPEMYEPKYRISCDLFWPHPSILLLSILLLRYK